MTYKITNEKVILHRFDVSQERFEVYLPGDNEIIIQTSRSWIFWTQIDVWINGLVRYRTHDNLYLARDENTAVYVISHLKPNQLETSIKSVNINLYITKKIT